MKQDEIIHTLVKRIKKIISITNNHENDIHFFRINVFNAR